MFTVHKSYDNTSPPYIYVMYIYAHTPPYTYVMYIYMYIQTYVIIKDNI